MSDLANVGWVLMSDVKPYYHDPELEEVTGLWCPGLAPGKTMKNFWVRKDDPDKKKKIAVLRRRYRYRRPGSRRAIPPGVRFRVFARSGFRCVYCGAAAPEARLVIDHVVPLAKGGTDHEANLAAACQECNSGKAATVWT